ncbi:uncharacterized protein EDB91DRAFT_1120151 [Suillus paluster]|uniref:uncharacterized protein n=1 Tax=Suillus paluster TaxID=48578 RepID=UPI001B884CF6|nr:uncharacterized protein EDB91DRAFT_1120151 [Suillus paluster]KAG1746003.1 hypothetical protein EDB91DRAFT_1120151 [Suillus paluster]
MYWFSDNRTKILGSLTMLLAISAEVDGVQILTSVQKPNDLSNHIHFYHVNHRATVHLLQLRRSLALSGSTKFSDRLLSLLDFRRKDQEKDQKAM